MKRYTPEELAEVLRLHKLWLNDKEGGERADLTSADLTEADLTSADLTRANLTRANLTRADLTGADLTRADGVGHFVEVGPIGSRNDRTRYTPSTGQVACGCFRGSLDEFEAAVLKTHVEGTEYRRQYLAAIAMFRALEEK